MTAVSAAAGVRFALIVAAGFAGPLAGASSPFRAANGFAASAALGVAAFFASALAAAAAPPTTNGCCSAGTSLSCRRTSPGRSPCACTSGRRSRRRSRCRPPGRKFLRAWPTGLQRPRRLRSAQADIVSRLGIGRAGGKVRLGAAAGSSSPLRRATGPLLTTAGDEPPGTTNAWLHLGHLTSCRARWPAPCRRPCSSGTGR